MACFHFSIGREIIVVPIAFYRTEINSLNTLRGILLDAMSSKAEHMELVDQGETICDRCGTRYRPQEQEIPENASFYWVPSCPDCGSKITANPTSQSWLNIVGSSLDSDDDSYESRFDNLNAYARLYHGRMTDMSVEELVDLAKWFDRCAKTGTAYGPRFYRPVAFALRQQAREQVSN